jgi:leucyl-tRNA synthetase
MSNTDKYNNNIKEKKTPASQKSASKRPEKFNHSEIEHKWQVLWQKEKTYFPDLTKSENKFYNLWMFPYPSAEGMHAGHAFASTGSDIYGRFMRMQGKNVFQPFGYDSFGIHSENYAIKIGENPHDVVKRTTKHYEEQMRSLGHGYDWTHTVTTSDPDYYKWTQWLFLKMFEAGLAYKKKASVNFCPSCKTVLADEQVMSPKQAGKEPKDASGKLIAYSIEHMADLKVCERCGTVVEKKDLDQWFFKITDYADRLLEGLDRIDWSERVVQAQRNWIGKSEGMLIDFKKENGEVFSVFTTRPDTLNTATFIVIADEKLYNQENPEKVGEFTGEYAINPLTGKKLPIWKTNYVAPGYGTGAVMGVPAYDERDREFADKYHLDIVSEEPDETLWSKIEKEGWGKKHTNFHLRDWLVSRQRYWGAPIPIIYCRKCLENDKLQITNDKFQTIEKDGIKYAVHAVPENDLPVLLPSISDYKPEGTGKGPLANHKEFWQVKCPKCGGEAERETDVMDTFVDSSWYFLRYPSVPQLSGASDQSSDELKTDNREYAFDPEITKNWLPVDLYFGGAEHSVLHLMYARFVTKVLFDLKLLSFDEPFPKFFAHGLMIKDGAKMSKSRGNVVNPDEYIVKFGADTLRLYVMFLGPMDAYPDFRDSGIEGMQRFVSRLWKLFNLPIKQLSSQSVNQLDSKLNQTIKKVTEDMYNFKYNTAIASIMELVNVLEDNQNSISISVLKSLCLLIAPFAPHLAEEVWVEVLNQPFSVHKANWPVCDDSKISSDIVTVTLQINGKVRSTLNLNIKKASDEDEVKKLAEKDTNLSKWLEGKKIIKTIFIPGKILNFVV